MSVTYPFVSVVIATRDRGDRIVQTIDSLLANQYPAFEIRVVDQSNDTSCQLAMQQYAAEPRVIYQLSLSVGMARARNIAIAQSKSDLIAITDDDCVVSPQWIESIATTFTMYPKVTMLFGNVLPGQHDPAIGFIPTYCRNRLKIVSNPLNKPQVDGLGACMAMRKRVWETFGGFDEALGVGGLLKSSSEGDLAIHALNKGYQICETPSVSVVHNGFRTWEEGVELIGRYWYGTGAMYGKHLRLYPVSTFLTLVLLAWRWAFGTSRVAASLGEETQKSARLQAFVSGFLRGLWLSIDRKTGHFNPQSS
ncbi:MAG: glycosyltransferase family A protein [Cyanobacteria bacterium J06621_11]